MKRIAFTILIFVSSLSVMAQNNYYPSTGGVLLGTPDNFNFDNYNLQLHTFECSTSNPSGKSGPCYYPVRFAMTNQITGRSASHGFEITLSNQTVNLFNYAQGNIAFGLAGTNGLSFNIDRSSNRMYFGGGSVTTSSTKGRYNFYGSLDNGIYVETPTPGKFGISFKSAALTDNAIQVMGTDGNTRNFSVKANGYVYARKYTTTLNNIPDYVFLPSYKLMSFTDLRTFVYTNHHLPNVPSANDYQQNGVDLGEMNRVLLEKTEELTLYILQLEERLKKLEENQGQTTKE